MRPAWVWGAVAGLLLLVWLGLVPRLFGLPAWVPLDTGALADLALRTIPHPIAARGAGILYWLVAWALVPTAGATLWWRLRRGPVRLRLQLRTQERRVELVARDAAAEQTWEAFQEAEQAGDLDAQIRHLTAYEDQVELALLTRPDRQQRLDRCIEAADRIGRTDPTRAAALLRRADELIRGEATRQSGLWPLVRHDVAGFALGATMGLTGLPLLGMLAAVTLGVAVFALKILLIFMFLLLLLALFGG